jgi:uncharacterized membrane protein YjgN (DUF898 family)
MSATPSTAAAANATAPRLPAKPMPFRFTGSGGEYFRIWIVNILLTLLTLGIYSAWAKVRRNRYFYGHTSLGDASFEYLAEPMAILKGRLIAFAIFALYALAGHFWPPAQIVFFVLFMVALPWLVVKSLMFRARNTAYRHIRFNFTGVNREALMVYVLLPMLLVPTLGLILPYIVYRQKQFMVSRSAYGTAAFTFQAVARDFYKIYLLALGILLGAILLMVALMPIAPWLAPFVLAPLYLWLFAYVTGQTSNRVFNNARLEMHGFRSTLATKDLFLLYLTNALAIVFTFGLFIPWARVRLARYRAGRLELLAVGELTRFVASEQKKVGSAGEEVGEMFDIDIGL